MLKAHVEKIEQNEKAYFQEDNSANKYIAALMSRYHQWIRYGKRAIRPCQTDGYNNEIIAALIAANYLERTSNDPRLRERYSDDLEQFRAIQAEIMELSRW